MSPSLDVKATQLERGKPLRAAFKRVQHSGQDVAALELMFETYTLCAATCGVRWFDFGITNGEEGAAQN